MKETEADTRANRIDPVLRDAGWDGSQGSQVSREYIIAEGRITTAGRINPLKADYVLSRQGRHLAVVEAKRAGLGYTDGLVPRHRENERLNPSCQLACSG